MGESFSPDVVAKLNEKWLPDEAGTSCLSFLNRIFKLRNQTDHFSSFLDFSDGRGTRVGAVFHKELSESALIRLDHEQSVKECDWLQTRLTELLTQLDLSGHGCDFLNMGQPWGGASRTDLDSVQLSELGRKELKRVEDGFEELSYQLYGVAREQELPKDWKCQWGLNPHDRPDAHWMETYPVRTIFELIDHLSLRHAWLVQRGGDSKKKILRIVCTEIRNARLAVRKFIENPQERPTFSAALPMDIEEAERQLEQLIDDLTLIAKEIKAPSTAIFERKGKADPYPFQLADSETVAEPEQLILNNTCLGILNALDGKAMRVQQLADAVTESETTRLYRDGLLKILKANGKIVHDPKIGYYRPDAPPPERVAKVVKLDAKK